MAESKRIFNAGKMNRDLDDRLVQPGEYRDALNVNIGRSEGSDVGALENLKGNELVSGQENIEGTAIGHVRDQANNRIYWFTKGDTVDAIHEYDMSTGTVVPILLDQVSNPEMKPTCNPDFDTPISRPVDDGNNRPPPAGFPPVPAGGCTDMNAFNFDSDATFDDGTCVARVFGCTNPAANNYNANANTDDGSCTFNPTGDMFEFANAVVTCTSIPQAGSTDVLGDNLFTATVGTIQSITPNTVAENTTTSPITHSFTINVTGNIPTGQGFLNEGDPFDVTGSEDCVQPGTVALQTFNFSWLPSGSIPNATISGGQSGFEGTEATPTTGHGSTITIAPDTGFQWRAAPTFNTTPPVPSGVTETLNVTVGSTNAGSLTLGGTWTPDSDYSGTVAFTDAMGGSIEVVPPTAEAGEPSQTSGRAQLPNQFGIGGGSTVPTGGGRINFPIIGNPPAGDWIVSYMMPAGWVITTSVGSPVRNGDPVTSFDLQFFVVPHVSETAGTTRDITIIFTHINSGLDVEFPFEIEVFA